MSLITSLDAFDDLNRIFEADVKRRLSDIIIKNEYTIKTVIDKVFTVPSLNLVELLSKLGTVYYSNHYHIIGSNYVLQIEVLSESMKEVQLGFSFFSNLQDKVEIQQKIETLFTAYFKEQKVAIISWGIITSHGFDTVDTQTILDEVIHPEAYPQVNMEKFVDDYLNSQSSILLLIGSSGMGKTRFIRYIMSKMYDKYITEMATKDESPMRILNPDESKYDELSVLYSMDQKIFTEESFFMQFIQKDYNLMVLEDIDFNLKSRKQGNTFMYKLLGISDGLIKSINKKIILSTNLPSQSDIDDALLRPGRCFGTIVFDKLPLVAANALRVKLGKEPYVKGGPYTVAECYNE